MQGGREVRAERTWGGRSGGRGQGGAEGVARTLRAETLSYSLFCLLVFGMVFPLHLNLSQPLCVRIELTP